MPKLTQSVPKYRLHRQSGQAITTINGRDHLLGPHGTKASKLQYDRLITEWLSSGRSASYGAPEQSYTVVEMLADYLKYAKAYYGDGPRSTTAAMKYAVRPLLELYGRTPAADFGVLQFRAVRQSLMGGDAARSYVNQIMRKNVAVFRWAAAEGKIPASVPQTLAIVPGLRKGKCDLREPPPVLPVEDSTVDATLPFMPDVIADMVRLQRLTGCRPAEVCILRPCDLDRTGDVWIYRPEEHKTAHHGHARTILIGPKAQAVLLRYLARDSETYCFRPCDSMAKFLAAKFAARKTPLSSGNRPGTNRRRKPRKQPGQCYTTCSYRRAIHNACDKAFSHPMLALVDADKLTSGETAEIQQWQKSKRWKLTPDQSDDLEEWRKAHRWSPNQLRHAAATEVRREFGLEAAQIMLGHSNANVTQVYAERDLAKGLEVAKRIG